VAKKVPGSVSKVTADKPSNLFRRLSTVLLVNSSAFAAASPTMQTGVLTENSGLPVLFVASFSELSNRKLIRDKLLRGDDVSRELEFNGIELSDEERRVLALVTPILEKIGAIGPKYPWLPEKDFSHEILFVKHGGSDRIKRSGNYIGKSTASRIWNKAAPFWAGMTAKPARHDVPTNGASYNNRDVNYNDDGVVIGCQTVARAEVEFIARHYGWELAAE
jgi:hypothetical protein